MSTAQATVAEANASIFDIIRSNPQKRLYCHPLEWTHDHQRLLIGKWVEERPQQDDDEEKDADAVPQSAATTTPLWDTDLPYYISVLAGDGSSFVKHPIMIGLVHRNSRLKHWTDWAMSNNANPPTLPLFFSNKEVTRLPVQCVFFNPKPNWLAKLAYLAEDDITSARRRYFVRPVARQDPKCRKDRKGRRVRKVRKRLNEFVRRLQEIKLNKAMPSACLEDPYITAALIAMAQQQQRSPALPPTDVIKVQLLLTLAGSQTHIYLFTGLIPMSFLNRFDSPNQSPLSSSTSISARPCLSYSRIAFEPYDSFPARLLSVVDLDHDAVLDDNRKPVAATRGSEITESS
ncbi:hypothetical protein AAE478_002499 [Parahypoxylon ruwenzoriense]